MAEESAKGRKGEPTGQASEKVDVRAFENDLRTTLDWLAEESGAEPGLGDCPETDLVISHARGERQVGLSEHVQNCQKCSDLVSYVRQRDSVYQRQRAYFLKQVESEHKDEPWLASFDKVLRQAFRPFAFLTKTRALIAEFAIVLIAVGIVWQLPSFVASYRSIPGNDSLDARRVWASRKVEADYGSIQNASAQDPKAAESVLGDLRLATQRGGLATPEKVDNVLAAVQTKKTEAPEKSADWERIGSQLQVYAVLTRYAHLRSEKRMGAPVWKDFVGGTQEDGDALIFLSREPSYDPETYKLLGQSGVQTKGITGVTLVTPSNKKVTVTPSMVTGFGGRIYAASASGAGNREAARTSGFGDPNEGATTAVDILDKPRPEYTAEARTLKIEGDVVLDVVFLADGSLQINRIVTRLGHGLDEAAVRAARQIKFKPAKRDGEAVDFPARVRIEFRLRY